jgi:SAM-dependent methyltransferase
VLDVGCGTGALSAALLEGGTPHVTGIDASEPYVSHANATLGSPRARFEVGDAARLPFDGGAFDAAVSGLVLNFVQSPTAMVAEMRRVVRHEGVVALYVWDYAGRMELLRRFWDAAVALDPAAHALDEGVRFPICQPDALAALLRGSGLRAVESGHVDQPLVFSDFDDYWSPLLGGQGPAPGYVASLQAAQQEALRDAVRARLPKDRDGSIRLVARAWTVKGVR